MAETKYHELLEITRRRPLAPEEQAVAAEWLRAHPEVAADWEVERRLTECLHRLPEPQLPSNFTAQVMAALDRADRASNRSAGSWFPRWRTVWIGWQGAAAASLTAALLLGAQMVRQAQVRSEVSRAIVALPAAGLEDVDLWRDFDSIAHLAVAPLPSVDELTEVLR